MPEKNIIAELKKSPTTPVQVHESDPAVVAGVQEFLAAHQSTAAEEAKKERVEIKPNDDFSGETQDQAFLKEAFVPVKDIEISQDELRTYLKSLLTDEPVRLSIALCGGRMKYDMRTRTTFEQRRVFDVLDWQIKHKKLDGQGNYALYVTVMQQYFALLMVERVNDVLFCDLNLKPEGTIEQHSAELEKVAAKQFESMSTLNWMSMLNAMRIFEAKCAKMSENAANEDFWKPLS